MELIPKTERVKALVRVTIPVAHSLEFEISLFRFPSRTVSLAAFVSASRIVLAVSQK